MGNIKYIWSYQINNKDKKDEGTIEAEHYEKFTGGNGTFVLF